ncbi:Leucine-rich repeat protein kinase family protein, partial [Prunus dulcis]
HLHASTISTTHLQTEQHRFRWNHHTSFFPFQPTATSNRLCRRRKQPRNEAILTVLRPRIRIRRDPLRTLDWVVRERRTDHRRTSFEGIDCTCWLRICSVIALARGRLCQNFGRKSRFLVSGPGIREMSVTRRDSLRFLRISGQDSTDRESEARILRNREPIGLDNRDQSDLPIWTKLA